MFIKRRCLSSSPSPAREGCCRDCGAPVECLQYCPQTGLLHSSHVRNDGSQQGSVDDDDEFGELFGIRGESVPKALKPQEEEPTTPPTPEIKASEVIHLPTKLIVETSQATPTQLSEGEQVIRPITSLIKTTPSTLLNNVSEIQLLPKASAPFALFKSISSQAFVPQVTAPEVQRPTPVTVPFAEFKEKNDLNSEEKLKDIATAVIDKRLPQPGEGLSVDSEVSCTPALQEINPQRQTLSPEGMNVITELSIASESCTPAIQEWNDRNTGGVGIEPQSTVKRLTSTQDTDSYVSGILDELNRQQRIKSKRSYEYPQRSSGDRLLNLLNSRDQQTDNLNDLFQEPQSTEKKHPLYTMDEVKEILRIKYNVRTLSAAVELLYGNSVMADVGFFKSLRNYIKMESAQMPQKCLTSRASLNELSKPTPFRSLNRLLNDVSGSIIELSGESGCGKTHFLHITAVAIAHRMASVGGKVLFFDPSSSFSRKKITHFGGNNSVVHQPVSSLNKLLELLVSVEAIGFPICIIVDALSLLLDAAPRSVGSLVASRLRQISNKGITIFYSAFSTPLPRPWEGLVTRILLTRRVVLQDGSQIINKDGISVRLYVSRCRNCADQYVDLVLPV